MDVRLDQSLASLFLSAHLSLETSCHRRQCGLTLQPQHDVSIPSGSFIFNVPLSAALFNFVTHLCYVISGVSSSLFHFSFPQPFRCAASSTSVTEILERQRRTMWVPNPADHSADSKAYIERWVRVLGCQDSPPTYSGSDLKSSNGPRRNARGRSPLLFERLLRADSPSSHRQSCQHHTAPRAFHTRKHFLACGARSLTRFSTHCLLCLL